MRGQRPPATVALFTPVPSLHIEDDGLARCRERGRVAFGTRAFQVLRQLERTANGRPVTVYVYASRTGRNPAATHRGRYLGHKANSKMTREDWLCRPSSTWVCADDRDQWPTYYFLADLERLAVPIPIRRFRSLATHRPLVNHAPQGPILVSAGIAAAEEEPPPPPAA
jgi:hypothetical protein